MKAKATLFLSLLLAQSTIQATVIDDTLREMMKQYRTPVAGYAIVDGNKIVAANTLSNDLSIAVNNNSMFQAASISKSVTSYGFLTLVKKYKINLTDSANAYLTSWQIPTNKFNRTSPVKLKQLLNMTSGLSVAGYAGYEQGLKLPSLLQILDGKPPANSEAIRVFQSPGKQYFYSGGSFQVLQQIMTDFDKKPFSKIMADNVLAPLAMKHSIYQYPLTNKNRSKAIPGFWQDGKMLKGGWNNYAIAASGGLWSTPSDLARFGISISKAYSGEDNTLISHSLAEKMLTRGQNTDYGLGVVVSGKDKNLNFRKNGHNYGYHCQILMFPNTKQGIVIMTNSENGTYVIDYMIPYIAKLYDMPSFFPFYDELVMIPE